MVFGGSNQAAVAERFGVAECFQRSVWRRPSWPPLEFLHIQAAALAIWAKEGVPTLKGSSG
jgi:hypothetical protein